MPLFILAVIVFIIADIIIRFAIKTVNEKNSAKSEKQYLKKAFMLISAKKQFH